MVPNLNYQTELKLVHLVTKDSSFEISLLIEIDYYWQTVQDEIVWGGPVSVMSKN